MTIASATILQKTKFLRRTPVWIFIQQLTRLLMSVFFDLKTYGIYNVPKDGGVLLVSNHQSYIDPVAMASHLDRPLSYLAKSELFHNRYFGWLLRNLNAFPVEQGSGDLGAVREAIHRLQEGHLLNIFPEGSRSFDGELAPLEKGVGLIIRRAKVPVVPVAIDGAFDAWPRDGKLRTKPVRILIGKPIYDLWKLERDEIVARIGQEIGKLFDDLRAGRIPPNPPRPRGRKWN